jgi:NAD(P)-dependent dehydrogenase (short-subunit alcohol dehydrogenase family)
VTVGLRAGLLDGLRVVTAGAGTTTVVDRLRGLHADVTNLEVEVVLDEEPAERWFEQHKAPAALIVDTRWQFGDGGDLGLARALELGWRAVRAAATGAMIQRGGGRLLLVAPAEGAGTRARAARAGLENLARTLSVEWARFGITAVAIAPGAACSDRELADLIAFLVSPAGGYLSGCRFDLGGASSACSTMDSSSTSASRPPGG